MSEPEDMAMADQMAKQQEHIEKLEELLVDIEEYLQHKANCAWLLSKKPCDCGLVELQTRVHVELDEPDADEPEEDETEEDDEKHE